MDEYENILLVGNEVWKYATIINKLSVFNIVFMAESILFFCCCVFIAR